MQFWLEFAAGGGQATGAICLYLMHLRRGEWRDAKYWARQIEALERELCQYAPVPHEVVDTTTRVRLQTDLAQSRNEASVTAAS
ncbi:hypothetical protein [Streptomyces coeruleorubidus]|uniref:hypothetical protein n=1 Tax=Streptomyces coeruleorubidus TaxID=116188 RepID=UPI00368C9095